MRVCLVTLEGKGKFEITQAKYRLSEEQKQEEGQKLFDFCGECIGDVKQREAHHVGHPFFPINGLLFGRSTYETMRNAYRAVTSGTFATSPSHAGINCDMCKQNPLIGVRFKCLDCTGRSHTWCPWIQIVRLMVF